MYDAGLQVLSDSSIKDAATHVSTHMDATALDACVLGYVLYLSLTCIPIRYKLLLPPLEIALSAADHDIDIGPQQSASGEII